MTKDKNVLMIEKNTLEVNKTYKFTDAHNPRIVADYWFQNPVEGYTLFIVFYTQACRWAKCLGCNLPSKMSLEHIGFSDIMMQTDFVFDYILNHKQKQELRKFIISNNGSILDEQTFSSTALMYFMARMNRECPNISVLSLESRPEYIDWEELEILSRALKEGQTPTNLEICIGFEAYDDTIRNDHFKKGLDFAKFEDMAKKLAKYNFKLKTYFMLKPVPGLSEEDAVEDIRKGVEYLDTVAKKFKLDINMHLNPTYAAYGTALEEEFNKGNFIPPQLESVRQAVLACEHTDISLYVGLNDEGLAVPGGSFIREGDEALLEKLDAFNKSQDYTILK